MWRHVAKEVIFTIGTQCLCCCYATQCLCCCYVRVLSLTCGRRHFVLVVATQCLSGCYVTSCVCYVTWLLCMTSHGCYVTSHSNDGVMMISWSTDLVIIHFQFRSRDHVLPVSVWSRDHDIVINYVIGQCESRDYFQPITSHVVLENHTKALFQSELNHFSLNYNRV